MYAINRPLVGRRWCDETYLLVWSVDDLGFLAFTSTVHSAYSAYSDYRPTVPTVPTVPTLVRK
jgi:hypothetical protein